MTFVPTESSGLKASIRNEQMRKKPRSEMRMPTGFLIRKIGRKHVNYIKAGNAVQIIVDILFYTVPRRLFLPEIIRQE
jgi:hypothetical protein